MVELHMEALALKAAERGSGAQSGRKRLWGSERQEEALGLRVAGRGSGAQSGRKSDGARN